MRGFAAIAVVCFLAAGARAADEQITAEDRAAAAARARPAQSPLDRAVEEFKTRTRELGLRADSPASTKKTANKPKYHGRIFENLRNDFFDAVPHEIVQRGGTRGLLRRNQFGFNVAGPVFIPRLFNGGRTTFFSFSYEGTREKIARSWLRTVPTMAERRGDFSQTVDANGVPLPIFDPQTTRRNPNYDPAREISESNLEYLRDPFPGNRIPEHRLDPVAVRTAAMMPEPNSNAGPFFHNNYFTVSPETNVADGVIIKVDHALASKHRLEFSGALSNGVAGTANFFNNAADPAGPDSEFQSRSGSVEHIYTISPRTINTFGFDAWGSVWQNKAEAFPIYRYGGYLPTGKYNPNGRTVDAAFNIRNGTSFKRGKHSLRLNAMHRRIRVHSLGDWTPAGVYDFGPGLTSLPGIVNTGHPYATYMLGMAQSAELTRSYSPSYFRRTVSSLGLRDNYELRPNLTLSAGLNFEVSTPRVEKYDRQSTVSFDAVNPANGKPGALVAANRNGVGRGFQPVRTYVEPTLGIAWNPDTNAKMVVRAEISRRYNSIPIYGGQFGTQGFNAGETWISRNAQLEPVFVLDQGTPELRPLPDLRPDSVNDMVADYIDGSGRMPTVDSASVSVERELPGNLVVTVGAGHTRGENMLIGNMAEDLNAIPLDALSYRDRLNDETFRRSLRPFPQYVGFELAALYPGGRYQRDASFLKVEKRTSRGLSLTAMYEFAKQMDDYSGTGVQDFTNPDNEWAITPYTNPHRFTMNYMYELPFGPGKTMFAWNDWRRMLVEGWAFSGTTVVNSGDPLVLRAMFNNTGGVVRYLRPNVVPGVDPSVPNRGPDMWFNPAAFVHPGDFAIGNASRTHPTLLMPGSQNHDLSVTKRFPLDAERSVELSAVGFNFINHANWTDPDTWIGSEDTPNANAGKIIGSKGGRVIQLGLRYSF